MFNLILSILCFAWLYSFSMRSRILIYYDGSWIFFFFLTLVGVNFFKLISFFIICLITLNSFCSLFTFIVWGFRQLWARDSFDTWEWLSFLSSRDISLGSSGAETLLSRLCLYERTIFLILLVALPLTTFAGDETTECVVLSMSLRGERMCLD